MNTTNLISVEDAEKAKHRAKYARLQITNPDAAHLILKEHIKKQLLNSVERGPVQILPLANRLFI